MNSKEPNYKEYDGNNATWIIVFNPDNEKDSNMEWATLTAHQYFDVNTGRAKVRVFSRSKAVEWMYGQTATDVEVYSISAALKDNNSGNYQLWIYDADPNAQEVKMLPDMAYKLFGVAPYRNYIDVLTNYTTAGIDYWSPDTDYILLHFAIR